MGIIASTFKWETVDEQGNPRSLGAQLIDPVGAFYKRSAFNPYAGPDLDSINPSTGLQDEQEDEDTPVEDPTEADDSLSSPPPAPF